MRKVIVSEFVTLDGVMEDPGGADKSAYGGWSMAFWNDEIAKYKTDEFYAADALLLGRVTYQGFAAAWPAMGGDGGYGDRMNNLPKHVATTTLTEFAWNNSRRIAGDVAAAVAALKQQPGMDILVFGSCGLIQTLAKHNLVDEYRLMIHPVIVGGGRRVFGEGLARQTLELVESKTLGKDVVVLTYRPGA